MNRILLPSRQLLLPLLLLAGACTWVALQPMPGTQPPDRAPAPASAAGFQSLGDFAASAGSQDADVASPIHTAAIDPVSLDQHSDSPPDPAVQFAAEAAVSVLESTSQLPAPTLNSPAPMWPSEDRPQPAPNAPPPAAPLLSLGNQTAEANASQPTIRGISPELVEAALDQPDSSSPEEIAKTDFSVLANNDPMPLREATLPAEAPNLAPLEVPPREPLSTTPPLPWLSEPVPFMPPSAVRDTAPPTAPSAAPSAAALTTPLSTPSNAPVPKKNPATSYLLESLKPGRTTDGVEVPPTLEDFSAPPTNFDSFNPSADMQIYQGKQLYATQRPLLELGRPWYQLGQLPPAQSWFGLHNPVSQQFLIFGDVRSAVAANQLGGDSQSLFAYQANLFFDWRFTGTERIHFNINPFTQGANNSRYLFDDDDFVSEFNADMVFGFFEGDLGAIVGGWTNTTLPFDLPIALGVMPLVIQNGIWLDDAFLGAALTIPARNSPLLDISNYDVTFFAGWDKLDSPAFGVDDNAAKVYGTASWIEALNGYIEADYAFIEDRDSVRDRSYHNIGLGYTRRFGHLLSNSTRVIVNAGQSTEGGPNTADGVLLLSENSLITANPSTILPYFNLFAGFDRPQSVGRAGIAGGILRNTGILFETDNLTGYPTLDATANQTYGMALGLSMMPQNFSQQLVLEAAMLGVMGDDLDRNAEAAQRGLGFRYQLPLNNSVIFRVDGMYGFLAETEDISGLRVELRRKF